MALLAGVAGWRGERVLAWICGLGAIVLAGAFTELAHRPGPPPELDAALPSTLLLNGCVVEPPAIAGDRSRFVLELERGARVQVSLYSPDQAAAFPRLPYGQRIEMEARVRRPHNFANPGGFDYVRYLARKQIHWTASARWDTPIQTLPGACGSAPAGVVLKLRSQALERIEQLYCGDAYQTGMMQAILIGESFQLEKVWTEQFRSTGTFHALVISGAHVAVLAAFFLGLLRLLMAPAGAAMLLTVLAAWLYALVTGWQAPVIRSAAGLTLFMVGRFFYRERRILNLLAAVAIVFLVLDPEQMFEPSFQLSFLSVAFLAVFALPLLERTSVPFARGLGDLRDLALDPHLPPKVAQFRVELRLLGETVRLWTRLPRKFCSALVTIPWGVVFYGFELLIISGVIQLGLALPLVVYFHRVGISGFSANLLVVPLMTALVPIGFIALLTGWTLAAKAAAALLAAAQAVVSWHAALEPNWRIPSPPLWLALALSAMLLLAALTWRASRRWVLAPALATLALLALLLWHPFPPDIQEGRLELTAIDVGQGDSLLVAFPEGQVMLVDGGGILSFGRRATPRLDIGEDVISPYLWSRSIRRIDVVAISHAHQDHVGGISALLDNFQIGQIWTGALPASAAWDAIQEKAAKRGLRMAPLQRGSAFDLGGARIDVLAPSASYQPAKEPGNNDSLVLRLAYGRHTFVLTGDIERRIEEELIRENLITKADVLKIAHHGSRTSTGDQFLEAVRPAFALISAGFENPYGHPHPDVLSRLSARRVPVFRTDRDGLISIRSDGRRLQIATAEDFLGARGLYRAF